MCNKIKHAFERMHSCYFSPDSAISLVLFHLALCVNYWLSRWAMFGFAVGMLTEYATGSDFVDQVKILLSNFGIVDLDWIFLDIWGSNYCQICGECFSVFGLICSIAFALFHLACVTDISVLQKYRAFFFPGISMESYTEQMIKSMSFSTFPKVKQFSRMREENARCTKLVFLFWLQEVA